MIYIIKSQTVNDPESGLPLARQAQIIIAQNNAAYFWLVGGLPLEGDLLPVLEADFEMLWREAQRGGAAVDFRAWALAELNRWRGARRAALGLTSANFQELVYTGKVLESQRWLAAPGSVFGLAGEAATHGITNEAMAALVLAQWSAWQAGSDAIEAGYIAARAAVAAAGDEAAMAAVLAGLE